MDRVRRSLAAGATGLVILVILAGVFVVDPFQWRLPATSPSAQSSAPPPSSSPVADAEAVAAVVSHMAEDPAGGAASSTRPTVDAQTALPPGSKLNPDPASWAPDGIGGGTMDVVVSAPGQPDVGFVAVMVNEGGSWKVLGTMEQTAGPAAP